MAETRRKAHARTYSLEEKVFWLSAIDKYKSMKRDITQAKYLKNLAIENNVPVPGPASFHRWQHERYYQINHAGGRRRKKKIDKRYLNRHPKAEEAAYRVVSQRISILFHDVCTLTRHYCMNLSD